MVGGRTKVWGGQCYRLSDLDFKAASHDGFGEDWPTSYKDVAPYHDTVERYVGITGMREGHDVLPDGQFIPPMGMSCNVPGSSKMKDFLRGCGMQGGTGVGFDAAAPGFGEAYKKAAKEPVETFRFLGYGETLPRLKTMWNWSRRFATLLVSRFYGCTLFGVTTSGT